MPRPTKYCEERSKVITDRLAAGCTRRAAYECAGVDAATFARWMARYAEFADGVTRAEAAAEVRMTASIMKAAQGGDWRAAESWLKRRRRADWGDSIDVRRLDDDTILRLLERAEGIEGGGDTPGASAG